MKRVAHKASKRQAPKYGAKEKKHAASSGSRFEDERFQLMIKNMKEYIQGEKMSAKDRKRLKELNAQDEREERKERLEFLFERLPVLKDVQAKLDKSLFNRLIKMLSRELDVAAKEGFESAPRYGESSSNSGRGDTWTCAPGTHGTSCPCVGPHIPGPSGLY